MFEGEIAHSDEITAGLAWIENCFPDIDLNLICVWISAGKLRGDRGGFGIHRGEPKWVFSGRSKHIFGFDGLGKPVAVAIDSAGVVFAAIWTEPVTTNFVGVRIEGAKEAVG